MLGGVPYHWKYSDGTEVPLNKLFGILTGEGVSLGLYTDETGNANTANLAKVFITGNTSATRGGGIGSNGNVTIGTEDETTEIAVSKNWDDEDNKLGLRPESIEIELWRKISGSSDDPVYIGFETIKPDVDGNWSLTFLNLPANNGSLDLYEYSIRERVVSGYSPVISGDAATGFEIVNRKPVLPDTGFPVLYP
jgi:predicted outer membrane repeat protein